jgi:hypothetical protein
LKRLEILHRKLDDKGAFATAPAIAIDAADQSLAKTVDFDKPFPAGRSPLSTLLNHPRFFRSVMSFPVSKRDELSRSALHCLIVCVLRRKEVTDQSNQLLDVMIGIVPKLDAKWQFIVPHSTMRERNQNLVKARRS